MFFGFDLKEILMLPIKDEEARKHLLVGCFVDLAYRDGKIKLAQKESMLQATP